MRLIILIIRLSQLYIIVTIYYELNGKRRILQPRKKNLLKNFADTGDDYPEFDNNSEYSSISSIYSSLNDMDVDEVEIFWRYWRAKSHYLW